MTNLPFHPRLTIGNCTFINRSYVKYESSFILIQNAGYISLFRVSRTQLVSVLSF